MNLQPEISDAAKGRLFLIIIFAMSRYLLIFFFLFHYVKKMPVLPNKITETVWLETRFITTRIQGSTLNN
jgi:hypothetical protein